jgi:hypothetical protein
MVKQILTISTLLIYLCTYAQTDDPATATPVVPDFYSLGTTLNGNIASATGSGLTSVCGYTPTDDVFLQFTAVTQGLKIEGQTGDFDMVIELRDASDAGLECMNINAGIGGETMWLANLVPGNTYKIMVYSQDGNAGAGNFTIKSEWLPDVYIRDGWWPTNTGADVGNDPGYKINQMLSRRLTNGSEFPANVQALVQATEFRFTDQLTGDVCTTILTGTSAQVNLNSVQTNCNLCFGKDYDVDCQVMLEGQWCGYSELRSIFTEAEPNTVVTAGYENGSYNLMEQIRVDFVGSDQQIYWDLVTNNGTYPISFDYTANPTSWLYFQDVPCMRYNKIYSVQVTVEYCGVTGPMSDPVAIATTPLPYSMVRSQYCGTEQYQGATILCDFIEGADQYAWQFAPINEGDPEMQPIGPATVAYTPTTAIYMLDLGLTQGQAYRVGAKPFLGTSDGCGEEQEGDYGWFCEVVIIDPLDPAPPPLWSDDSTSLDTSNEMAERNIVNSLNDEILTLRLEQQSEKATMRLIDLNGRTVYSQAVYKANEAQFIQIPVLNLSPGIYIASVESEDGTQFQKILLK